MADKLYIGWSEADITPSTDKFISLSGQYYLRLTKEIHSRLKTVAVAFSCGDEQFITASITEPTAHLGHGIYCNCFADALKITYS